MPFRGIVRYADPLKSGRHPFQTYMLALAAFSGLPVLLGESPADSISMSLPFEITYFWRLMLFGGSIIALAGSYWPGKNYANALTVERLGLYMVGSAAVVYSIAIPAARVLAARTVVPHDYWEAIVGGLTASMIIFGFGISCLARARDIGKIIKRAAEVHSPRVETESEANE